MSALKALEKIERRLAQIQKTLNKVEGSFIYVCPYCETPYLKKGDLKIHFYQKHGKGAT
mgnify:CR=1 FL=1